MSAFEKVIELAPEWVKRAVPYVIGKPVDELRRERGFAADFSIVKLASNENPLGPSPRAIEAASVALRAAHIYPDGGGYYLRRKIAEVSQVQPEQVLLGNGSENILDLVCRALLKPGDEVVLSECCFPQFNLVATLAGASIRQAACRSDFSMDAAALIAAIGPSTRLVIVGHPDNPSGAFLDQSALLQIYDALPQGAVLLVDEAYHGLVESPRYRSSLEGESRLNDGRRAVITSRSFSKSYGLAGLRVAFAVMPAELCELVGRVRLPFNVSAPAQAAALAALEDQQHVERTRAVVSSGRAQLVNGCRRLGLEVIEGAANFFLLRAEDAAALSEQLSAQGVIVRPMTHPRMRSYLRISVGTSQENERFLSALERIMGKRD